MGQNVMDTIMPTEKLRPLLALTRREPLSVAVGLTTGSDEEALILLHKTSKPKKVMALLIAETSKAKATLNKSMSRFGVASVDPEYDPGILQIAISKEAPEKLQMQLTQVVKRFSFKAVEFTIDASLDEDSEVDADPAALAAELKALVARFPAANSPGAESLPELQTLARRSATGLKLNDLDGAAAALQRLRALLGTTPASPSGGVGGPGIDPAKLESYEKARRIWLGTLASVQAGRVRLIAAIKDAYDPEGLGDQVTALFTARTASLFTRYDDSLALALAAVIAEKDPLEHQAKLVLAGLIVRGHQSFLKGSMIETLDKCPMTSVTICQTLSTAIEAIGKSIG